jgi:GTPase SAR1 family protein
MADDLRKKLIPIFRVAVIGAASVGKTSIINSFVNNSFSPIYEETE